jgi:high-affinity Fe2+/Pb2+ permease
LFERLMVNRLKEKKLQEKKQPVAETVDPIFLDAKGEPIRFLNEKGEYEAGRIAAPDKDQMPRDAVEAVEQLLIWMPNDERLLWLLAETFNASAMEHQNKKGKSMAVLNANKIFQRLLNFETPTKYGLKEITKRQAVLQDYMDANPVDAIQIPVADPNDVKMTRLQWWRTLAVAFALGLAIGMFALWQTQEMRRRRQARAAPGS